MLAKMLPIAALAFSTLVACAAAAEYPSKPIRLIVPYAPGGFVDITARTVAPGMSQELGEQVVVENRSGAGGALGLIALTKAAPDGYTVALAGTVYIVVAPLLYPKVATFARKDFVPVALVSETPLVMVLGPATSIRTVAELVDAAKARPGKLTMGSAGNGTTNHLAGELLKIVAGIGFEHVPYKGSGEAINDLVGGHIDFIFDQIPASIGFIRAGTVRAIGIASTRRSAQLPDVPTFAEAGWPDIIASTALGIVAPAGTPPEIVRKLNLAAVQALAKDATRAAITRAGAEPLGSTPEAFSATIDRDSERWTRVITTANIKLEQ